MVYDGSSEVNLKNNLLTVNMFVMYRGIKVVSFCPGFARFSCHSCKVQLLYSVNVCKCLYFPELYAIIIFLVVFHPPLPGWWFSPCRFFSHCFRNCGTSPRVRLCHGFFGILDRLHIPSQPRATLESSCRKRLSLGYAVFSFGHH